MSNRHHDLAIHRIDCSNVRSRRHVRRVRDSEAERPRKLNIRGRKWGRNHVDSIPRSRSADSECRSGKGNTCFL
jgi:hypothetical protein